MIIDEIKPKFKNLGRPMVCIYSSKVYAQNAKTTGIQISNRAEIRLGLELQLVLERASWRIRTILFELF